MDDVINLNTAERDELTRLPGVGPAMADRIIAGRPYETIDGLLSISGVGPAVFERLQPFITLADAEPPEDVIILGSETSTVPESDQVEVSEETTIDIKIEPIDITPDEEALVEKPETEEGEIQKDEIIPKDKAIIPVEEEDEGEGKPTKQPKPVTLGQTILIAAVCSFLAFVLAVLLSIGIIGSINNGLNYASTEQVLRLSRQMNELDSQIDVLLGDIDSLRTRIDNLESMSSRISELEALAEELTAEMTATVSEVGEMKAQIEEIVGKTERFQNFLEGLGDLMESLISEPQETP
jgi:competence protein ComEA